MKKAKSRLKPKQNEPVPSGKRPRRTKKRFSLPVWKRYLNYLPTLVISLPFYGGIYFLLINFYPNQLRNWLLPNTYLPLQLLLFIGNFFFFSFIFLKASYGLLLSLWFGWSLFLKLQPIENYLMVSGFSLLVVAVLEIISRFLTKKRAERS